MRLQLIFSVQTFIVSLETREKLLNYLSDYTLTFLNHLMDFKLVICNRAIVTPSNYLGKQGKKDSGRVIHASGYKMAHSGVHWKKLNIYYFFIFYRILN